MSALDLAVALATDLATVATLPAPFHAQLGDLVVDCAGTYVTVTNLTEVDPFGGLAVGTCEPIPMGTAVVVCARDCSFVANEKDGTTDWAKQDAVSLASDGDALVLWEHDDKWRADAWYLAPGAASTLTFTNTGGLAMVTLTTQLPVP